MMRADAATCVPRTHIGSRGMEPGCRCVSGGCGFGQFAGGAAAGGLAGGGEACQWITFHAPSAPRRNTTDRRDGDSKRR